MSDGVGVSRRKALQWMGASAAGMLLEPGVGFSQGNAIKIGHQADMTGFQAVYGYSLDIGAKTAVNYINSHGGVGGRPFQYQLEDTESEVPIGVRKFRKLVDENACDFVLGSVHSGINLATNPVAKEMKVVYIPQGESSVTTDKSGNRYIFRTRQHSKIQGLACVDFAVRELGKNWTFMITDFAYGQAFIADLAPMVEAAGGKVLNKVAVPLQTQDMIPYLAKVSRDTNVLFSVFVGPDAVRFMRQAYELGLSKQMARLSTWSMIDATSLKGAEDALEGAYFLSHSQRYLDQVPDHLRPFVGQARELMGINADCTLKTDASRLIETSYYLASWSSVFMLRDAIIGSAWKTRADNPKIIPYLERFSGKASLAYPMGDFRIRPNDHQGFQTLWIERVEKGKLHRVAEILPEKLNYQPAIDYSKEALS
jgi:branched-chain amino acid transport system substrate-binding protein